MPHAVFYDYSLPDVFFQRILEAKEEKPEPSKAKKDYSPVESNPNCDTENKEKSSEA